MNIFLALELTVIFLCACERVCVCVSFLTNECVASCLFDAYHILFSSAFMSFLSRIFDFFVLLCFVFTLLRSSCKSLLCLGCSHCEMSAVFKSWGLQVIAADMSLCQFFFHRTLCLLSVLIFMLFSCQEWNTFLMLHIA